ncbi:MAG: hypothetical protein JRN51_08230 [Nitrososphaerota archaeon]|nr:hypothetical protein [Nitrososphaerota archaeon]
MDTICRVFTSTAKCILRYPSFTYQARRIQFLPLWALTVDESITMLTEPFDLTSRASGSTRMWFALLSMAY